MASVSWLNAQTCPYGEINDPYPGKCARYVDTNGDGICDLSQEAAEDSSDAETLNNDNSDNSVFTEEKATESESMDNESEEGDDSYHKENAVTEDSEGSQQRHGYGKDRNNSSDENSDNADAFVNKSFQVSQKQSLKRKPADRYGLAFIIPVWILMMAGTVLVKNQKLKRFKLCDVNTAWNWLILASFAVVAITSIALLMREYGIVKIAVSGWVQMHNVSGIIFILASIGHIYLKYQYYILVVKGSIRSVK